MNDKLKALQGRISQYCSNDKRGCPKYPPNTLVSVTIRSSEKEKKDYIRISFHKRILSLTRWQSGDKLDMEISGNNAVVFRTNSGGKTLGSYNSKGATRPPVRFALPYGITKDIPSGIATKVETAPGKVAFVWPE